MPKMQFCGAKSFMVKTSTLVISFKLSTKFVWFEITLKYIQMEFCRKTCPVKWSFKYIHDNAVNERVKAMCLRCQLQISEPTSTQMENHHERCTKKNHAICDVANAVAKTNTLEKSNQIEYVYESSVAQREIVAQRRISSNLLAPGFRLSFCSTPKGLERFTECQICKKSVKKPSRFSYTYHRYGKSKLILQFARMLFIFIHFYLVFLRKFCPLQGEVLVNVTTEPSDPEFEISSNVQDTYTGPVQRICFICNTTASESFVNIYETVSRRSLTLICDFVWRFLNDTPSVREDVSDSARSKWSLICKRCLDKINEYDLACVTASQLEEEIRYELSSTEAIYAGQQITVEQDMQMIDASQQNVVVEENTTSNDPISSATNDTNIIQHETDDRAHDPLSVPIDETINLDSPSSVEENGTESNDNVVCIVELSDDDDDVQAME